MSGAPQLGFSTTSDYVIGPSGEQAAEMSMDANQTLTWLHTNVFAAGALIATYDGAPSSAASAANNTNTGAPVDRSSSTGWNTFGLHFYFNDPLGSRRAQTDAFGLLEQTCASLPFGDALTCTGSTTTPTEHHFTGKERDTESGNDYFGARYFGSSMGRFMSPDPSQLYYANPIDPQSLNLYSYGRNNPLNNIDPTGLDCVTNNGNGTATTNVGDCDNSTKEKENAGHYIDCDGCTTKATGATLDAATGSMILTDKGGQEIDGTRINDWADPKGVSTTVTVNGNTGDVKVTGDGMGIGLGFPMAALPQLPDGTVRDPNAPPPLPKLKGNDKSLCLWGAMANEMMGGDSGPSDSSDTAPGKGGAEPIPFHTTTRGGKPVTRQMGVDAGGGAKADAYTMLGNYFVNSVVCFLNNWSR